MVLLARTTAAGAGKVDRHARSRALIIVKALHFNLLHAMIMMQQLIGS
jgi:hypothetical protein